MLTVIEKQYMESVIRINQRMRKAEEAGPDWEQRRYEIAKDAMAAMLSNPSLFEMKADGEPVWLGKRPVAQWRIRGAVTPCAMAPLTLENKIFLTPK